MRALPWLGLLLTCQAAAEGELAIAELGVCELSGGQVIEDCRVGYRTFGRLDDERGNAILFPTWYEGTTQQLVDFGYIGPGRLADTSRYFVIAVDALGNGVSSSPSNSPADTAFPETSIADMVQSQQRLLTEELGIDGLHAVVGISMGGMQALEWSVRHPLAMRRVVAIVATPWQTAYDLLLWETQLIAIQRFAATDYESTLRVVAGLNGLMRYSHTYVARETAVNDYDALVTEVIAGVRAFDLYDRVPQLQAMIGHDIANGFGGSRQAAIDAVRAEMLLVVAPMDHMVNPAPSRSFAAASGARLVELDGDCGHLSIVCDGGRIAGLVNDFLRVGD